jgi:arginine-tRNA-protein transferase
VDPDIEMDAELYDLLLRQGFRRSGRHVYRPWCGHCSACISSRIPVAHFRPRRIQRRVWRRNQDLSVRVMPGQFRSGQFELYQRYLRARHQDGGMDPDDPGAYTTFLISPWCETRFYEFRAGQRLLAVAVVDVLKSGLSAVYTFFDPVEPHRSLGVHALLYQIEQARSMGLPYVYLGYWVPGSRKMDYKSGFHPLEIYRDKRWQALSH